MTAGTLFRGGTRSDLVGPYLSQFLLLDIPISTLMCEQRQQPAATTRALKAMWFQKWFVHRQLRPEAYGGWVERTRTSPGSYPLHSDVMNSAALTATISATGSALLPQAFPEGSPMHPSYGAGHAVVAAACVTVLTSYTGPGSNQLTVGDELNKLASNVAIGRNHAGVHWYSDYIHSLRLGEEIAIDLLKEQQPTYREKASFSLTRFDGTVISI